MKRVLVYPCGTEIGLEIYRALSTSIHYEIIGGSCSYDHGRFVYKNHIDDLPFITDRSTEEEITEFNNIIAEYNIDIIYPAMDGVVTVFSKYRDLLTPVVIAPAYDTAKITRSKRATYELFYGLIPIPHMFEDVVNENDLPVFVKPDVGQGSVGTKLIKTLDQLSEIKDDKKYLVLEYLPGEEYTVDCFTNSEGKLVYCKGRTRKRTKNGISVNAIFAEREEFRKYAEIINSKLNQKGGWFFQLKESKTGELKLLEIASRIAGASAISRNIGANLPLLSVNEYSGIVCNDVVLNDYYIEMDRALENRYSIDCKYEKVYMDYDDTVVKNNWVNTNVIKFIYQCVNNGIKVVLLSKHTGDLEAELKRFRISELFDEVIHLEKADKKYLHISGSNSIFIDDSYGERKEVAEKLGIPVFDVNTVECLLED